MKRVIVWVVVVMALLAVIVATLCFMNDGDGEKPSSRVDAKGGSTFQSSKPRGNVVSKLAGHTGASALESGGEDGAAPSPEDAEPQTEEEKAEAAAEAKVEAFDDLTDSWMDPSKSGISMKDVDSFVAAFRKVPKDRQDECIHRALNLIPDDNVMLLAGVLMDKTMDKEIAETVFNDVLNRDDDVKKPILQQIFKDKSHPCWADTAWILDVTGELPRREK